jgi:NADH-quinone oxidoreductase subunit C
LRPDAGEIADILRNAGISAEVSDEALGVIVRVPASRVLVTLDALKGGLSGLGMLVDLFANDTGERLEVTYHLRSLSTKADLYARVGLPYDGELPSVWRIFPAALYAEREAAEMFGMTFSGHPNPKRLLTTDEVEGPLLRKSLPVRDDEGVRRHA